MDAIRQVIFRPSARTGVMGAALAVGIFALTSIQAGAATVGSATATAGVGCRNLDTVQLTWAGVSYAVPAGGGVITSWSTTALINPGPAGLLVWRPTATPGTYTLVAATTPTALLPGLNTFNLTTPIPVQAGDVLGLRAAGGIDCGASAAMGNTMGYHVGTTAVPGAQEAFLTDPGTFTLDVSATIGTVPTTTTPPPTGGGGGTGGGGTGGGGTGGGGTGGGGTGTGNNGGGDQTGNHSGDGSDPTKTKSDPTKDKADPGHHKKVKGTPTETHSESVEAIFLF
jgi:hypothetical protein